MNKLTHYRRESSGVLGNQSRAIGDKGGLDDKRVTKIEKDEPDEDKNNTTHQRASDQSGRRRSGVCPISKQMNPEGGEEETIKDHA